MSTISNVFDELANRQDVAYGIFGVPPLTLLEERGKAREATAPFQVSNTDPIVQADVQNGSQAVILQNCQSTQMPLRSGAVGDVAICGC